MAIFDQGSIQDLYRSTACSVKMRDLEVNEWDV
jgi:hypothetical protein